jgi:hypothetical protein
MRTKEYEERIHYLMVQPIPKPNERPITRQRFHLLQKLRQWTGHLLSKFRLSDRQSQRRQ